MGAVALGATAGGVVATAAGAAAAYGGSKLINKATSGSSTGSVGSLPNDPINIDKIITDARTAAAENYKTSLALERANNPAQAAYRDATTAAATAAAKVPIGATPYTGSATSASLLNESADDILAELRLGGSLPADVQAEIARASLSKSGQAGLAGSFAARGLLAKDIGTNSLALGNARRTAALQAGGLLEQLGLARAQFGLQQEVAGVNAANLFKTTADSFALPNPGLDPGAIASLYTADRNALNQVNQNQFLIDQQNANARAANLNKLLGFGAQAFSEYKKPATLNWNGPEPTYSPTFQ